MNKSATAGTPGGGPSDGHFDAIVLGAGISGLVSASILLAQGIERVLIVDDYDDVGGNHIDSAYGEYSFDVGSFVFQDDSPLLTHFPEILPLYVPINPTWGKINPQGINSQYPFSIKDDFLATGLVQCGLILLSVLAARLRRRHLRNARDFAQYWIGARLLQRSGLEKYMERFCGLPAEQIDLKFAQKRMLWISEYASVLNLLRRVVTSRIKVSPDQPANQQLARPKEGFAQLYQPAVDRLTKEGATFELAAGMKRLGKLDGQFQLATRCAHFTAPRVVSTVPINLLEDLCDMSPQLRLPTVTLISLFFSFEGERGFPQSILYNFSYSGAWKRLTMYSDFYGRSHDREYFTVEVIAAQKPQSVHDAVADFRRHAMENEIFRGELRLEGSHILEHAYPIYTGGAGDRADASIAAMRDFGIESFGRQGGFQYQPTARVSTVEAEAALRVN